MVTVSLILMTLFPVLVDIYHKEQLVTKEEAEKVASDEREWRLRGGRRWGWKWIDVTVTKDASTATRIADILDKYGFIDVAQHIRGECVYSRLCV